jgi:hypothetical protein
MDQQRGRVHQELGPELELEPELEPVPEDRGYSATPAGLLFWGENHDLGVVRGVGALDCGRAEPELGLRPGGAAAGRNWL